MNRWFIKGLQADINRISKETGLSRELSLLLANRGLANKEDIDLFLNPKIENMFKPELMKDIIISGDIIQDCIEKGKKIRIIGDYDVDGIVSVYILYRSLRKAGAKVDYVIPDRIQDGYGINQLIVLEAKAHGIDTIITVDNGISAHSQIRLGKEMGMRMIITDHHDIPETLPEADAVVNPKQSDCKYPEKLLCGAGVAYKLAVHVMERYGLDHQMDDFLELAAIATICDVVDLVGENRIIVVNGLRKLNNTRNIGLKALIEASSLTEKILGVYHVGFILGPSLNASGRLESALVGLNLLLSEDKSDADNIATKLRELNEERRTLTEEGYKRIENKIENKNGLDYVIVEYAPEIHESVAGIVAGRIKEKYNRPTIVLTDAKEGIKGSGRSIEGYNMSEELSKCSDILDKFGGHPMAAGLSLQETNIDALRDRLNSLSSLTDEELIPKVYIDMALDPSRLDMYFLEDIQRLEPYGKGNPKPQFGFKGLKVHRASVLGKNRNVLKLSFGKDQNEQLEGIIFSDIDEWITLAGEAFGAEEVEKVLRGLSNNITMDIVYNPMINEYMGRSSIQFVISSYRFET